MEKRIPKRRFKEFIGTGEWQEKKLGEVVIIRRGLTYSPSDVQKEGIIVLRSSNIKQNRLVLNTDDVFVKKEAVNIDLIKENDILITSANGSSHLVGKHALVNNLKNKAVHGGFMLIASAKKPFFINALMSSAWYVKFIKRHIAGGNGAIGNLKKNDLENHKIFVPSLAEQEKIGDFFQKLDRLIDLNREKLDKLKASKSAYLEEMFPGEGEDRPKRRFKGFTGKWEEKKLGEVVDIQSGLSPSKFSKGNELYIKVDDLNFSKREQLHSKMMVNFNPKLDMINKNSIIFPKRGAAIMTNKVRILKRKAYIDTNMMALEPLDINTNFLYMYIYKIGLYKIADTSTIPQINNKHIKPYEIKIPSLAEQERIGHFFKKLDDQIGLQEEKLEKLEKMKKAYLAEMFV